MCPVPLCDHVTDGDNQQWMLSDKLRQGEEGHTGSYAVICLQGAPIIC